METGNLASTTGFSEAINGPLLRLGPEGVVPTLGLLSSGHNGNAWIQESKCFQLFLLEAPKFASTKG